MGFHAYTSRKEKYCVLHMEGNSLSNEEKQYINQQLNSLAVTEDNLVIYVTDLQYINSQLLGQLLIAFKAIKKKKGNFALVGPRGSVLDLLKITGMDKVFPVYLSKADFEKTA